MIYKTDKGYVISSKEMWLPGIYETEEAAQFAFQFDDETLQELNDRICHKNGEQRLITTEDLQEASRKKKELWHIRHRRRRKYQGEENSSCRSSGVYSLLWRSFSCLWSF